MTQGILFKVILVLLVSAGFPIRALANWLCDWDYRKPIMVTEGSGADLTNYQVRVDITYESNMNTDFSDLRFTLSDGATEIDYWIEQYGSGISAIVWVEVPDLSALSTDTIFMYYGNPLAVTTSSAAATFVFFDDFEIYSFVPFVNYLSQCYFLIFFIG